MKPCLSYALRQIGHTYTNNGFMQTCGSIDTDSLMLVFIHCKTTWLTVISSHRLAAGSKRGGTSGTLCPGPVGTGAREDESAHAKFFFNQAKNV